MQFSKIAILSIVALATAMPNAQPEPEAHQLEARTFSWLFPKKGGCDCKCEEGNKGWKRDGDLEVRTLSWLLPLLTKDQCPKECEKKCDDYYDDQEKKCKEAAKDKYKKAKYACQSSHHKRTNDCEDKCKKDYDSGKQWCEGKWKY